MAKNLKLGSILKSKKDGSLYIKLDDKVSVSYDGKPITGKFINMQNPHTLPEELLSKGIITENVAAEMAQKAAAIPFVRFNLTVKAEA